MIPKLPLIAAATGVLLLAACEPAPFDPNDPNKNRRDGAIAGAVLGGLTGAAVGDNSRFDEIVAGAVIGGVAGGVIGNQLDKQAAELDRALGSNVSVIRQGDQLIVRMPQDILFDVDSATVRPALRGDLFTLADSLQRYPDTTVVVVGHTDNTGSAAYNQDLSERRADAVAVILTGAGVERFRVRAVGAGEDQPIASNLTPEGRQQNRRVEFIIREN
ncbi:MAG: OmpA family protein [Pseudomonadota bacterium]